MYHSQSILAQVEKQGSSNLPIALLLRRLRRCADLHILSNGTAISTVTSIPSVLKDSVHCVPTEDDPAYACTAPGSGNREVYIKVMQPMQVCILWPALQEPPRWLSEGYQLVRGAEVQVGV